MRDLGLVVRDAPITELRQSRSRNSLYWIADAYLDFWYRFVDPSQSLVARGLGERLWDQTITPALGQHISRPTFERAARQYLWRALGAGALPASLSFTDIGTWWGSGGREIDIVATDAANKVALVGSCRWTNAPMDVSEYAALLADTGRAAADLCVAPASIGTTDVPCIALFSRTGFTERLRDLAASQNPAQLLLIGLDEMYR